MPNPLNLKSGQRFGHVTIIKRNGSKYGCSQWLCRCDCGLEKNIIGKNLKKGSVIGCGCFRGKKSTHGMSNSPIYSIWSGMKKRCYLKSDISYKNYGGRGIKVCKRWMKFENFYADMKDDYKSGLTLDRIDNSKGYLPGNCRWVDGYIQANNRRNNVILNYEGRKQTLSQWAREKGIKASTLYMRLFRYNWPIYKALK